VALSRLKSLDGLVLTAPIQFNAISQDKTLVDYAENKPKTEDVTQLIRSGNGFVFEGLYLEEPMTLCGYILA
jgi:hypothetical protein